MSAEKIDTLIIRFPKKYEKLKDVGNSATLLYAGFISLETPDMVTFYHDLISYDLKADGITPLPAYGQYVICIFRDDSSGNIFTALKPSNEDNINKYFRNVGKPFEVVINVK